MNESRILGTSDAASTGACTVEPLQTYRFDGYIALIIIPALLLATLERTRLATKQ